MIQGQLGAAEERCREAVAVLEDALGSDHLQVVPSLVRLAEVITRKVCPSHDASHRPVVVCGVRV